MRFLNNRRGQASILVAIIFQVLFIFFAMVINVGLLVHDKINLQNSVDIAAYYGAMKQAEVLNAMGQVNYQIRQGWKLFNWRLWALSNSGRIAVFNQNNGGSGGGGGDKTVTWTDNYTDGPIVCVAHRIWYDNKIRGQENLCHNANLNVPPPTPIKLSPAQLFPAFAAVLGPYVSQSQRNYNLFNADFAGSGNANYIMALRILSSYKATVARRRASMQALQNLLIGQNLQDLSGHSVQATVQNVLNKNLTLPNKNTVQMTFQNSLSQQPFLVPIEVRTFIRYEDLDKGTGTVRDITTQPQEGDTTIPAAQAQIFYGPDYLQAGVTPSASEFAQESDPLHNMNSLVGFEKNPWILAYVSVSATTQPKMLFSPFSGGQTVTLSATAYAMPFGGHIGPWYYDSWPSDSGYSQGGNKIDKLLPPRMNEGSYDGSSVGPAPNYSRFPGDALGMRSEAAEDALVGPIFSFPQSQLPHFNGDDYANLSSVPDDPKQDPLVTSNANPNSPIRNIEIAAIAPDLFDALYYPVQAQFSSDFGLQTVGGDNLFTTLCQGRCYDLGSILSASPVTPERVSDQITMASNAYKSQAFWILNNPNSLNTAWTQEATDDYGGTTHPPTKVGQSVPNGGRVGYSVKLVSAHFLQNPALPFGGSGGTGAIKNPPQ